MERLKGWYAKFKKGWRSDKWRRVALWGAAFGLTVLVSVLWDKREEFPKSEDGCAAKQEYLTGAENTMFGVIRPRHRRPSESVVLLLSDERVPPGTGSNPCLGREWMSHVIDALNDLRAQVIVIDKFYSPDGCPDPTKNDLLWRAITEGPAKVVVGRESGAVKGADCLATKPNLFDTPPRNVRLAEGHPTLALTKKSSEVVKVPLQWPVQGQPKPQNGLALAAAELMKPGIENGERLRTYLREGEHPIGKFKTDIKRFALQDLFCSDPRERDLVIKKMDWSTTCSNGPQLDFTRKVVVVGDENERDEWDFLGEMESGAQLQARYIDAILNDSYLGEFPFWPVFISWLLLSALLQAAYLVLDEDGRWWRAIVVSAVTAVFLGVLTVFLYWLDYFPPIEYIAKTGALLVLAPLLEISVWFLKKTKREQPAEGVQ